MAVIDSPEKAMRLARAIASDISLYNEEKIREGIENDTFFDAVAGELEEGRELYKSRVSPQIYESTNFYDRAVVDIIIRSKGHIRSKLW
jgi:spore germination protein GerM